MMFKINSSGTMSIVENDSMIFDVTFKNYTLTTGDRCVFTIKKNIEDNTPILEVEGTNAGNVSTFSIPRFNIEVGNYVYDIKAILSNGIVDTVVLPNKLDVLRGVSNE